MFYETNKESYKSTVDLIEAYCLIKRNIFSKF
jgi:hypothetical protein